MSSALAQGSMAADYGLLYIVHYMSSVFMLQANVANPGTSMPSARAEAYTCLSSADTITEN